MLVFDIVDNINNMFYNSDNNNQSLIIITLIYAFKKSIKSMKNKVQFLDKVSIQLLLSLK